MLLALAAALIFAIPGVSRAQVDGAGAAAPEQQAYEASAPPQTPEASPVPPAPEKPKIAVYVFGAEDPALNKAMAARLISALAGGGRYYTAENYKAFFEQAVAEQKDGAAAPLTAEQTGRLGGQFGVQYVCVAEIATVFGENHVSANIVDVETGDITATGAADVPLKTLADLTAAAEQLIEAMFKTAPAPASAQSTELAQPQAAPAPPPEPEPVADNVPAVTGAANDVLDRVVAAVNAFKDATVKSIDAANAVKTAVQSKNFSAIMDAKKKVQGAVEAVKKAKTDVTAAIEAVKTAGPEAEAAAKAMGIDFSMFAGNDGDDGAADTAGGGGRNVCSVYSGADNPALVNEETRKSARFLFSNTMEGFYAQETGFNMPMSRSGAVGVSWIARSAPKYAATDANGFETGQKIAAQSHFFAFSFAQRFFGSITVGSNFNLILLDRPEFDVGGRVGNAMRFGFGVDMGTTYKLLNHRLLGNHLIGVSTSNAVCTIIDSDEEYPAEQRFSLLSDFWEGRVCYSADFVLKDFLAGSDGYVSGATRVAPWEFNHKIGGSIMRIFKVYALAGFNNEGLGRYGFALGAGAGSFMKSGFFRDAEAMFQYVAIPNGSEPVDDAGQITFFARTEFGKHR